MIRYVSICLLPIICFCCETRFLVNDDSNKDCDVLTRIESGWVCGRVRTAERGVRYASFRGVPYAQQPLGTLRFKELQPLDPWNNVLVTTEDGPICPQHDEVYGILAQPACMSESCILANIHVPLESYDSEMKTISHKTGLPILVFIHGGGFQAGSGNSDLHGPEYLVCKGVIIFTFNYRLNVFGFLSLNSSYVPGNNGLKDAYYFLKWVQRNARSFGGNPDDVTLAGQSCGSAAAHLLSLSEVCAGLFKRLILLSGLANGNFYTASPAYAKDVATMFLGSLGVNTTNPKEIHDQLTQMPLEKIMDANRIVQNKTGLTSFVPVVESKHSGVTRILDDYPANLIKQGRGKDLPMIVGTTSQECQFFKRRFYCIDIIGCIEENPLLILPPNITYSVSENEAFELAKIVDDRYFQKHPTVDEFIKFCTNSLFEYPAYKLAEWRASLGAAPLYLYQFAYNSDFNPIKIGLKLAYDGGGLHLEDQTYILHVNSMKYPKDTSYRHNLMKRWMTTVVVNFIRCSHPMCDHQSDWPAVHEGKFNYQLIEEPESIRNINLMGDQRDMFNFHDKLHAMAEGTSS